MIQIMQWKFGKVQKFKRLEEILYVRTKRSI